MTQKPPQGLNRQVLAARLAHAASLVRQGLLVEALDTITECIRLGPQEEAVRRGAADILMRLRRPHEALAHVQAVAAMTGGVVEQVELAKALDAAGRHEEALAAYRRATTLSLARCSPSVRPMGRT